LSREEVTSFAETVGERLQDGVDLQLVMLDLLLEERLQDDGRRSRVLEGEQAVDRPREG